MNKKHPGTFNLGTSSILVVFIILCLTTFAVLSLVSARGDYKLSLVQKDRTTAYYSASNQAELKLADLDAALADCYNRTSNEADYFSAVQEKYNLAENHTLEWTETISDDQLLRVRLSINYPSENNQAYYALDSWTTEETESWNGDYQMNLIKTEASNP